MLRVIKEEQVPSLDDANAWLRKNANLRYTDVLSITKDTTAISTPYLGGTRHIEYEDSYTIFYWSDTK